MRDRFLIIILLSALLAGYGCSNNSVQSHSVTILTTNDIHGRVFPYDYVDSSLLDYSLASIATVVRETRESLGDDKVILIDNGDFLQGDNSVFYYNYIDSSSSHIFTDIVKYLKYDATIIGNHDIETGHEVYDKLYKIDKNPYLAANVLNLERGKPYFDSYKIINRDGLKIAIIGMTNPNIKKWLSEDLWRGMEFCEISPLLQELVDKVKKKEQPHLMVVAMHAGLGEYDNYDGYEVENPARFIASNTKGIDIIFAAHDHKTACEKIFNGEDSVLLMSGGARASHLSRVDVALETQDRRVVGKNIKGTSIPMKGIAPDEGYMAYFSKHYELVRDFSIEKIGFLNNDLNSTDAFKGSSGYIDMIHMVQMEVSGADISFAAPLSIRMEIGSGSLMYQDLFKIYPYENQLYVINLTGQEVKNYLEYSYSLWINKIPSRDGHLLKVESKENSKLFFINNTYNFDSASGINYDVDIMREDGDRVTIHSMADGSPFNTSKVYRVALSSYRVNGGGDHLLIGCGISKDEVEERVVSKMGDVRDIIYEKIKREGILNAIPLNNWRFVPETESSRLLERDLSLIF